MSDLISRKAAIDALTRKMVSIPTAGEKDLMGDVNRIRAEDISVIRRLPSAQPDVPDTNVGDTISRQAAIDALKRISFPYWFECGEYLSEDTREIEIISSSKALEAIEALPSAQPEPLDEWCTDCKEYDTERHCCPRFNHVIRETVQEMRGEE